MAIFFAEAAINFAKGFGHLEMRQILAVNHEICAVQARGSLEAIGEIGGGTENIPAAHAIADAPCGTMFHVRIAIQEFEDAGDIRDDHVVGQLGQGRENTRFLLGGQRIKGDHLALGVTEFVSDIALPVIQIGHNAKIADRRNATGDVEQLLTQPPNVHENEDRWEWAAL